MFIHYCSEMGYPLTLCFEFIEKVYSHKLFSWIINAQSLQDIMPYPPKKVITYFCPSVYKFLHLTLRVSVVTAHVQWVPQLFEHQEFFHVKKTCEIECCDISGPHPLC